MKLPVCKPHFEPLCSISKITFCSVRRIFRFLLLSFFSDIRFLVRWLVFLLLLKCHKLFQMNCFDGFVLHLSTFDLGLFTLLNCLYSFAAAFRLAYRIIRCVFISFWIVHVFFLLSFVLSCQFHINNFFLPNTFCCEYFYTKFTQIKQEPGWIIRIESNTRLLPTNVRCCCCLSNPFHRSHSYSAAFDSARMYI